MANTSNVNSSVPIETPNANPTVGLPASAVNFVLVGEVPVVLPTMASTTPAINSFMRNMPDPVMSQYMSQGNVPMANPYMNSVPLPMNHMEKPDKFSGPNFKRWQQKMLFYLTTLNLGRFLTEDAPKPNSGEERDVQVWNAIDA